MEAVRILLILVILVIFIYVMARLLAKREKILSMKTIEGLTTAAEADINNLKKKYPLMNSIKNITPERSQMPLAQYCIKGSYNSAYSGTVLSGDAIKYVLSRGCRALDLEIADDVENGVSVIYSKGGETVGKNKASLVDIFSAISANAFFSGNTPNPEDPLFIYLRIKMSRGVYDKVAAIISEQFAKSRRYINVNGNAKPTNGSTMLKDIKSKVIFLMDKTVNPSWASDSSRLTKYINAEVGGTSWKMQSYGDIVNQAIDPPTLSDNFKSTNLYNEIILRPDNLEIYPTPRITDTIMNYGIQILLLRYYVYDEGMILNEDLFDTFKTGILPIAYAIQYSKQSNVELKENKIVY